MAPLKCLLILLCPFLSNIVRAEWSIPGLSFQKAFGSNASAEAKMEPVTYTLPKLPYAYDVSAFSLAYLKSDEPQNFHSISGVIVWSPISYLAC